MHKLLSNRPGERMLLLGNEALARGAVEAGVAFTSTYPGTPSSELSLNFFQMSRESDLHFEYCTNEKVAMEVSAGAAACGLRSMAVMKHVGLNVAADALMTLAYVGVKGGMVILTADDPAMFSSQNEQDNKNDDCDFLQGVFPMMDFFFMSRAILPQVASSFTVTNHCKWTENCVQPYSRRQTG